MRFHSLKVVATGTALESEDPKLAFTANQIDAYNEALGWNWTPDQGHANLSLNQSVSMDNYAPTFWPRRDDLAGRRSYRVAGFTYTNIDVLCMTVPDPIPGKVAVGQTDQHFHVRRCADNTIEVRLWSGLAAGGVGLTFGEYGSRAYFGEVLWRALFEVARVVLSESYGEPYVLDRLATVFGAYDTSVLAQGGYKDVFFSGRQGDSKGKARIQGVGHRRFHHHVIADLMYPPDVEPVYDDEDARYVSGYTAATASVPFPPWPKWVPQDGVDGYDGPGDYDPPKFVGVGHYGHWMWGGGWQWGGDNTCAPYLEWGPHPLSTYRRPPAPGSKVRFRIEWFPTGPTPAAPNVMQDMTDGHTLDPGVYGWNPGRPTNDPAEDLYTGPGGVVWGTGYRRMSGLYWPELHRAQEIDQLRAVLDNDGNPIYPTIYYDLAQPGAMEFELVVPHHDGELGIAFSGWLPWFRGSSFGSDVRGGFPLRTHPPAPGWDFSPGVAWDAYPDFAPARPYIGPEGKLIAAAEKAGAVRFDADGIEHIVVGNMSDAIPLIDPAAKGWIIEEGGRPVRRSTAQ